MSDDLAELSQAIIRVAPEVDGAMIVEPARVGDGPWLNELLLFIKPEVFLVPTPDALVCTMELVLHKVTQFNARIAGVAIVSGRVLDELGIMDRHYGLINRLSRGASEVLSEADREAMAKALSVSADQYDVLGGHELLAQYPNETIDDLDRLWFTSKSVKMRSGVYVRAIEREDRKIILVNGFHPAQLSHFTNPKHRIVLVLLHSDTEWISLRDRMIGATFPEQADPDSIRGTLHAEPQRFGFTAVTIANNAVHLSAGPFEGAFEIVNFFGNILGLDPAHQPPLVIRRIIEQGYPVERALATLDNPVITYDRKTVDLFTATEDMNTNEAIALWKATRQQ